MHAALDRWRPPPPVYCSPRRRRNWLALLAVLPLGAWFLLSPQPQEVQAAAADCDTEQQCRTELRRAVQRAERCLWSCSDEIERVGEQQNRLTSVLEADAQQLQTERQRSFEARRFREVERQRALAWQREKETQEIAHRQRLELVEARAAAARAAAAERLEQQVTYLKRLTPEQRRARLEACQKGGGRCDELTELLVRAAASPSEMRQLVDQNETPPDTTREAS